MEPTVKIPTRRTNIAALLRQFLLPAEEKGWWETWLKIGLVSMVVLGAYLLVHTFVIQGRPGPTVTRRWTTPGNGASPQVEVTQTRTWSEPAVPGFAPSFVGSPVSETETRKWTEAGKDPSAIEVTSTNVANLKELFPIYSAFVFVLGFFATAYQLRLARRQQEQTEAATKEQHELTKIANAQQLDQIREQQEATNEQLKLTREQQEQAEIWNRCQFVTTEMHAFTKDVSVVNFKRLIDSLDADYDPALILTMTDPETGELTQRQVVVDQQTVLNAFTINPRDCLDISKIHETRSFHKYVAEAEKYYVLPDDTAEAAGKKETAYAGALRSELERISIRRHSSHSDVELQVAYQLDAFCAYLIHFQNMVDKQVVRLDDLHPYLTYWLTALWKHRPGVSTDPVLRSKAILIRRTIHTYLYEYFKNVLDFSMKFADYLEKNPAQPENEPFDSTRRIWGEAE